MTLLRSINSGAEWQNRKTMGDYLMVRSTAMDEMGTRLDRIVALLEALVEATGRGEPRVKSETPVPPPSPAETVEDDQPQEAPEMPEQRAAERKVDRSHAPTASAAVPSTRIAARHRPVLQGKLKAVRPRKPVETFHQFSESCSVLEDDDNFVVKKIE